MLRRSILAAGASILLATAASAQNYPDRTITMIVPFAAGGPTDTVARLIAEPMTAQLGQQVIVEAAIAVGVDVTMLEQNLRLTPAERIRQLDEANRFLEEIQARTLPEQVRREREHQRLMEKLSALGRDLEDE